MAHARSTRQVSFGEVLREYRVAASLTQEALAERSGLSPRGISDLERGARRHPFPATVRRLADTLGLSEAERLALEQAADVSSRVEQRATLDRGYAPTGGMATGEFPVLHHRLVGRSVSDRALRQLPFFLRASSGARRSSRRWWGDSRKPGSSR